MIVTQGSWWNTQSAPEAVAIRDDVGGAVCAFSPGSRLSFQLGSKLLPVTVAAVYRWQQRSLASSFDYILPLQALTDVPVLYVGGIRLKPGTADAVQSAIYRKISSVTIFNLSDILGAFAAITNEMTLIVKCLAAFVIAAGLGVLTADVAGDRMERFQQSGIPEINRCDVAPDRGDVVDRIPAGRTVRRNHRRRFCEFIRRALSAPAVSLHATHRMGAHHHRPVRYGRACHRSRLVSELPSTTFATERSIALNRLAQPV